MQTLEKPVVQRFTADLNGLTSDAMVAVTNVAHWLNQASSCRLSEWKYRRLGRKGRADDEAANLAFYTGQADIAMDYARTLVPSAPARISAEALDDPW